MLHLIKSLYINSSIISFKIIKDNILLLTNSYIFIIIDKKTFEVIFRQQINKTFDIRHNYENSFSISENFDIFITEPKSSKAFLLKFNKNLQKNCIINFNDSPISSSAFNKKSDILAIGGEDGKVFLFSIPEKKMLQYLPTKPDYVSNISFFNNDKYMVINYYDKTNIIYSFNTALIEHEFISTSVIFKSIFNSNNDSLLGISENKKLINYNLIDKKQTVSDFEFSEWPTAIVKLNKNFILVGSRSKYLYIININKNKILKIIELDNEGINKLYIDNNKLYICFINGELKIINIKNHFDDFELNLKLNKYKEATKLTLSNIFLLTFEIAEKYDDDWNEILLDAKKLLISDDKQEAENLVKPFLFDEEKNDEFLFCLGNVQVYKAFSNLIENQRYIDAFKLVDDNKFLKKTKDFQAIEKNFLKIFHDAKNLFSTNTQISIKKAKELLNGYNSIKSKATLVNNLLLNHKIFTLSNLLIKERNFKKYFLLTNQNIFLQEEEIYKRVLMIGNQTFSKLITYQDNYDYEKALEVGEYLKDFIPLKRKVENQIIYIHKLMFLTKNIEKNSIRNVYEMIERDESLYLFPPFIEYHEKFITIKNKAHTLANEGNSISIKKVFRKYLNISYTIHLVAQEFKIAYLVQMEKELLKNSSNSINWDKTFKHYVSFFGLDNELIHFIEKFNFNKEFLEIKSSDKIDGYINKEFVESILIKGEK